MNWSTKKSLALYHIHAWSEGYVDINREGNVTIKPDGLDGYTYLEDN